MLRQATDAAMELVEIPEIVKTVRTESDLLLIFDCLMQDYINAHMEIDIEQFRALVFKNYLLRQQQDGASSNDSLLDEDDTPEVEVFEAVCTKLY
mmetsp:Transcript_1305/g.1962  ORF Transcript_1305/g.1962 Transcript_1305/m.1962 type:complete len:95 (+) Transcript_1305:350-634(+)